MEYRGHYIPEEISETDHEYIFEISGDNAKGEIILDSFEFSDFVDKLIEIRDNKLKPEKDEKKTVFIDLYEGYYPDGFGEMFDCRLCVYVDTTVKETEEKKNKRIEMTKKEIDESFELKENTEKKKHIMEIISELEDEGYEVKKKQ